MIYTSRYANPLLKSGDYTVVGITRGAPKFPLKYKLAGNIIEIAPPGYLFNVYDRAKFTPPYFMHMDRTGAERIQRILDSYANETPLVLCCFEDVRKPGEWCHRLVFAEWWLKRTGEMIEELPDTSPNKWEKSGKKALITPNDSPPQEKAEPEITQLRLW